MSHHEIAVDAIDPNPHRNFERNPIRDEQVDKIADSIGRTGFWDNVVVRRHPEKPGRYQLAYGHNRIAAIKKAGIKTVTLPVRDLGEADMYDTMVDENETQQTVSPQIAMENVEACLGMLEKTFNAIGPEGTKEQFYRHLGRAVSTDTTLHDGGFEQVRSDYFAGKGIGRRFLERFIRSVKVSNHDISELLKAHYAQKANDDAEVAHVEASEAEAAAANATDEEEAKRLSDEAEAKRQKAEAKRLVAEEVAGKAILPKILLSFETKRQMTDFAAAVRASSIPPKYHQRAADEIRTRKVYGDAMTSTLREWWYETSGQKRKDYERAVYEDARRSFLRRVKGGDFKSFLMGLRETMRKLSSDMRLAAPTAPYYEDQKYRDAACKDLKDLIESASELFDGLSGEALVIEPSNGHVKQLAHS